MECTHRGVFRCDGIGTGLPIVTLTGFLYANRYPLRSKARKIAACIAWRWIIAKWQSGTSFCCTHFGKRNRRHGHAANSQQKGDLRLSISL